MQRHPAMIIVLVLRGHVSPTMLARQVRQGFYQMTAPVFL
jgi:hypothetical protein